MRLLVFIATGAKDLSSIHYNYELNHTWVAGFVSECSPDYASRQNALLCTLYQFPLSLLPLHSQGLLLLPLHSRPVTLFIIGVGYTPACGARARYDIIKL